MKIARAKATCRYRIGNFVELTQGADVVIGEELPEAVAQRAKVVICIRPFLTGRLERAISRLRRRGTKVMADYDDLLFAGNVTGLPASAGGPGGDPARQAAYAAGLKVFDSFTVSTRELGQRLERLAPNARVSVVPNALSATWTMQGRLLYRRFRATDPLLIRYFPGSPSHDDDFASIAAPLRVFLERHPAVALEVVGLLRMNPAEFPAGRVRHLPSVSYDRLPELLATAWVNLAPLAPSTFAGCKSAIKFLESGAFGCPTLASPNDDLLRHCQQGAEPRVCAEQGDWDAHLEALLDLELREHLGQAAQSYVDRAGLAGAHRDAWLRALAVGSGS